MSEHTDRYIKHPPLESDPEGFVRTIERELESGGYDMLLPINERTVKPVLQHRARFERHTNVPFLPYERLRVGFDKVRTIEAARRHDVPHPETLFSDEADLDEVEAALGYPLVVKAPQGSGRDGVSVCHSRAEFERSFARTRAEHGTALFQEFIPNGGERGVYTFYNRSGDLAALTVQKRLRTNPPEGGVSTLRETVEDPTLVEITDRFLRALDWQGVAMAEFRIDARTGKPKLLEINPRLWGSLALSAYAGVDFPYLLYRSAVGDDPEPDLRYEAGVQCRCLFTDAVQVLKREDRRRAVGEFFESTWEPSCYDIVSKRDPLPTLGQVAYWIGTVLDDGPAIIHDVGREKLDLRIGGSRNKALSDDRYPR